MKVFQIFHFWILLKEARAEPSDSKWDRGSLSAAMAPAFEVRALALCSKMALVPTGPSQKIQLFKRVLSGGEVQIAAEVGIKVRTLREAEKVLSTCAHRFHPVSAQLSWGPSCLCCG